MTIGISIVSKKFGAMRTRLTLIVDAQAGIVSILGTIRPPLDEEPGAVDAAGQHRRIRQRDRAHARHSEQPLGHLLVERFDARRLVAVQLRVDAKQHEIVRD